MKTHEEVQQIERKLRDLFAGEADDFRPFAVFDERLDCIRVTVRQCSVVETRINDLLTVLEDNYEEPGPGRYVGFTIKGPKYFCITHGLPGSGPVRLTEILDKIVAVYPEPVVQLVVNVIARPMIKEQEAEIGTVVLTGPVPQAA